MALREHTLYERILENARCYPEVPAFICGDTQLSFREFAVQVERLSKGLRKVGLHPGSRLAILLDNGIEAMTLYAACARAIAGGITASLAAMNDGQKPDVSTVTLKSMPRSILPPAPPARRIIQPFTLPVFK